jgi:hypothetical protein
MTDNEIQEQIRQDTSDAQLFILEDRNQARAFASISDCKSIVGLYSASPRNAARRV